MTEARSNVTGRGVVHASSPIKGHGQGHSSYKARISAQDNASNSRSAVKLPAFPPKKAASGMLKSPSRHGQRTELLPDMTHAALKQKHLNAHQPSGADLLGTLPRYEVSEAGCSTSGFESPLKGHAAIQVAKDEVKEYLSHCRSRGALAPSQSSDDDDVVGCVSNDQHMALSTAGAPHASNAKQSTRELADVGASLTEDEFHAFTRDIAARIIQAHWRRWQRWKLKLRREAEERILKELLDGDAGGSLKLLLNSSGTTSGPDQVQQQNGDAHSGIGRKAAHAPGELLPAQLPLYKRTTDNEHPAQPSATPDAGVDEEQAFAAGVSHKAVRPRKQHPGGHSVYTFIPTPRSTSTTPAKVSAQSRNTGPPEAVAAQLPQTTAGGMTRSIEQLLTRVSGALHGGQPSFSSQDLTSLIKVVRASHAQPDASGAQSAAYPTQSDLTVDLGNAAAPVQRGNASALDDSADDLLGPGYMPSLDQDTLPGMASPNVSTRTAQDDARPQYSNASARDAGGACLSPDDEASSAIAGAGTHTLASDSVGGALPEIGRQTATHAASHMQPSTAEATGAAAADTCRQSRSNALQRLKQQGTQRSLLAGASTAPEQKAAQHHQAANLQQELQPPGMQEEKPAEAPTVTRPPQLPGSSAESRAEPTPVPHGPTTGAGRADSVAQVHLAGTNHPHAVATRVSATGYTAAEKHRMHDVRVHDSDKRGRPLTAAPRRRSLRGDLDGADTDHEDNNSTRPQGRPSELIGDSKAWPQQPPGRSWGVGRHEEQGSHATTGGGDPWGHPSRSAVAAAITAMPLAGKSTGAVPKTAHSASSSDNSDWEEDASKHRQPHSARRVPGTSTSHKLQVQRQQHGGLNEPPGVEGSQMHGTGRRSRYAPQAPSGMQHQQESSHQQLHNSDPATAPSVAQEAPQGRSAWDKDASHEQARRYEAGGRDSSVAGSFAQTAVPAGLHMAAQLPSVSACAATAPASQPHAQRATGLQLQQQEDRQGDEFRSRVAAQSDPGTRGPGPSGAGATGEVMVDASLTAEKMTSILNFLDEIEQQADQEMSRINMGGALQQEPSMGLTPRGQPAASHRVTSHSRPSTAHTSSAAAGGNSTGRAAAMQRSQPHALDREPSAKRHYSRSTSPALQDSMADDDAVSVDALSTVSGVPHRSAFLAESVYENVRNKIRRLQEEVKERDARIQDLQQDVQALQVAQRTVLLDSDARLQDMLAAQRAEYEAAVARHLAFVDRLLADKDVLGRKVNDLTEQLKGSEERQERAIAKLKEGWAAELRRQKEGWTAAEKQRREQWMEAKAAEIKDLTVKGLEGEVQKLLTRHKAELAAVQQQAAEEARKQLDAYIAQNEQAVKQMKERLAHELEEAVEKERGAGASRLREVSERYEQQLQTQRMRLVSDADLKLEQLEQGRKDDRRRLEETLAQAKEAAEARIRDMEQDWKREKEAMRKAHDKQIDSLREQYETGQEGWRAAMAERARKEVAERTAAIREKLMEERNAEIEAIMARLEAEHAAAHERLKEEARRREEATAAKHAAALKEARKAETKMAERFRAAGVASQAAEEKLVANEAQVKQLRKELESKTTTIRWLESQVTAAKEEAHARELDLRSLGAQRETFQVEVAQAVQREKQALEQRLAQAAQEHQELRARHSTEMSHVEARIKATLAKKDETIQQLRDQLAATMAELRSTQDVLRQQADELDEYD